MSSRPLPELHAAVAAGFTRWSDFCRARETGQFPEPARELPGFGPIWTQQQIDRWLGVESADADGPLMVGSKAARELDQESQPDSRGRSTEARGATTGVVPLPPGVPDDLILYTEEEAAKLLRINMRTLQDHRWRGWGPRFVRFGKKPLYRLSDLRAYLEQTTTPIT